MPSNIVTIGRFDGVHVGHQYIIKQVVERAAVKKKKSLVLTFDRHPMKTLRPESHPEILTPIDMRVRLIKALGVDEVRLMTFDKRMAGLTPAAFLEEVLTPADVAELLVGSDFKFGKDRAGDVDTLAAYAKSMGFMLTISPFFTLGGKKVGSSDIRHTLKAGDIETCKVMLGRNPGFEGVVIKGDGIGARLGFPTANLKTDDDLCLPRTGVYAGVIDVDGEARGCLVNVGYAPTMHKRIKPLIEIHIPGYGSPLYGKSLFVELIARIRDEIEFADERGLIKQLNEDTIKLQDMIIL